jgi:peptidoglycan/xylan/chitin deacetylase (PgdA/CDA1 family)
MPLTVNAESNVYHQQVNNEMKIALTFDDGPHPKITPKILDILSQYGIHATFFEIGENILYYTDVSKRVISEGHEIGNHTFSHPKMKDRVNLDLSGEMIKCDKIMCDMLGYKPHLFRPPEGVIDDGIKAIANDMGYRVILWSVDTRDWAQTPTDTMVTEILNNIRPGAIILMHDYIGKGCNTVEALKSVIPKLIDRGYSFVTVSELLET